MKVQEIVDVLAAAAPPAYQEAYDNAGLLTGDPAWEVQGILLTLDVTEAVVEEAVRQHCNMIVAHHPLIFRGLKRLTGANGVERTVIAALKQDIALYAAHTNLDNVADGVNRQICERLGLTDCQILVPQRGRLQKLCTFVPLAQAEQVRSALFAAGAGQIGSYSESSFNVQGTGTFKAGAGSHPYVGQQGERHREPEEKIEVIFPAVLQGALVTALKEAHPYEEVAYDIIALENASAAIGSGMIGMLPKPMEEIAFLKKIKEQMQADGIRYTALRGRPVQRVAVCGGAGSFLLPAAQKAGADVFVTADFKYHEFFEADGRLVVADIGHYESEQFTIEIFYQIITRKFRNFAPLKSKTRTNPINYLH